MGFYNLFLKTEKQKKEKIKNKSLLQILVCKSQFKIDHQFYLKKDTPSDVKMQPNFLKLEHTDLAHG